jgi:hypothetical protein
MGRASRESRQRRLVPLPSDSAYRRNRAADLRGKRQGYTPETEKDRYERTRNGSTARRLFDSQSAALTVSY